MGDRTCLAIVLAAGEGTRMRSARPKVLHEVAGRSLLAHVLAAVRAAGGTAAAVVVGPDADAVAAEAQARPAGRRDLRAGASGAAPRMRCWPRGPPSRAARRHPGDLRRHAADPAADAGAHARGAGRRARRSSCSASGRRIPTGYGRLVLEGGELVAIREELDASAAERAIDLCNGGLMAFAGATALAILERIGNDNRKGEYYLTDAVAIARAMKLKAVVIETEEDDVRGINTKAQLAETEAALQQRLRKAALEAGVTLVAPETVFLCGRHQVRPRRGGRAVRRVRAGRHGRGQRGDPLVLAISTARMSARARSVGPYARLRPGAQLGAGRAHRQFRRDQGSR